MGGRFKNGETFLTMTDNKGRTINYLRISVTDRCNLRCTYCMPEEGIRLLDHSQILSFSEIVGFTRVAVSMGVDKIRVTGGEPLVRNGITGLVKEIASIEGVKDLSMTTNGVLLTRFAEDLKKAGLMRVNISLDTTDPERYKTLTRGGDISQVINGIKAAKEAGLLPVKINCVVEKESNEPDALMVKEFASRNDLEVRFIHKMDLKRGEFGIVEGGDGGNCGICNRLRLTPTGMLKPCLFSDIEIDIRKYGAKEAIQHALNIKPVKGLVNRAGNFYNIGG